MAKWEDIKGWSSPKEAAEAAEAWQMFFWRKACWAFVVAVIIQAPFIGLWMALR